MTTRRICFQLLLTACAVSCGVPSMAQRVEFSSAHRNAEQGLPQTIAGGSAGLRATLQGSRAGVSLAAADFDSDGVPDLLTGYTTSSGGALLLQRGSALATAPTEIERAMMRRGELVTPFLAQAEAIELPVRPDLLRTADIHGHGHTDALVARQGDSTLYLLLGDGGGRFSAPRAVPLAGAVGSLAIWRSAAGNNLIVAGVCRAAGCGLQFLDKDGVTKAFVATPAPVSSIQTGAVHNGLRDDFALIAGGQVLVLDGDSALTARPALQTLPLVHAAALALGSFVFDRNPGLQIAVLDSAATLHVVALGGVDSTAFTTADRMARNRQNLARAALPGKLQAPGLPVKRTGAWTEIENLPNIGPGGTSAVMLRARLSGSGGDDLAVLAGSQFVTVTHPLSQEGTAVRTTPVVTIDSTSAPVAAALATRVSADARHGIVALSSGSDPLTVTPPGSSYRTMTADTLTDAVVTAAAKSACINKTAGCTLRAAITVANDDQASTGTGTSTIDTIMLNAGTYTISGTAANVGHGNLTPMNPDYYGSVNYHFEVDASVNFVGAGCTTSGTPSTPTSCSTVVNGNGKDQVFSINLATYYATSINDSLFKTIDVFFSGMTITNGANPNNPSSTVCANSGTCNFYGGNIGYIATGAANMVMNNVLITGGSSPYFNGGGIDVGYTGGTPGPLEIDNSSITNNSVAVSSGGDGGGGISVDEPVPLLLTSDLLSGNTSPGLGAALNTVPGAGAVTITNSLFSSNTSSADFGGAIAAYTAFSMSGTTLNNNKAIGYGAGLYLANGANTATVTTSTFTANTLTSAYTGGGVTYTSDGAGVCIEPSSTSGQAVVSLRYSRFHGNTGGAATGLAVGCNSASSQSNYATVTATDNWWGCNPTTSSGSIAGAGCDTAHVGNANNGTLTVSPYTTLTLGLNTSSLVQGGTITATASLGQDSAPTVFTAANDAAYLATPITAFSLTNTSGATYSPSATAFSSSAATGTSFAAATATGTTNASGAGTATLTVDGQTLTRTYTITAPADLTVASTHTGNFKAGDTADTYTLTVTNSGGTATSGTVTVTETLPPGFTATALTGSNWTCTLASLTCTRSDALGASASYPGITLTVSLSNFISGTYTNSVLVSGGGETNTANNTGADPTIVVGQPTISEGFSPGTVAPNVSSTVTFTLGNPGTNAVALTGVAFTDTLPAGLRVSTPSGASTTCTGGSLTAVAGSGSITLSGASIASGATCTVSANVVAAAIATYTNTTGTVTATNSNAGPTASATLTVTVTPTRLVYTAVPPTPISAGGNAGTVSVALEDAAGNIATNNSTTSVTLLVTNPGGYSQTYTATASNGGASFNLSSVPLTAASTYTYAASSSGLTSASTTEVVNSGPAAAFSVTGLTTFTAPQMSGTATVKALDAYGNTATGFTGTVTLTSTDTTAAFTPPSYTYVAGDSGTHTFTVTFNTAGTQTVTATSGALTGSETGILVQDAIWILNTNGTLARTTDAGVQTTATGTAGGAATYGAVAFDNTGNVWTVRSSTSTVQEYTKSGAAVPVSGSAGAGVTSPVSLFLDGAGQVWVANGNSTVSVLSNAGAAVTPSTGYQGGGMSGASGIVVDSAGSVWVTNRGNNSVTKIFGAAAPVATPLVTGTANNTLGTKP